MLSQYSTSASVSVGWCARSAVENGASVTAKRKTSWIHEKCRLLRASWPSWVPCPTQKMPSVGQVEHQERHADREDPVGNAGQPIEVRPRQLVVPVPAARPETHERRFL